MTYEEHVKSVVARLNERPLTAMERANISAALAACVPSAPPDYVAERLATRPELYVRKCWVYRYFDINGQLLYVGQTIDLPGRDKWHKVNASWYSQVSSRTTQEYPNQNAAEYAEAKAIRDENPAHNKTAPKVERWITR